MQKSANILLPVAKVLKSFGTNGELIIRYSPDTQEDIGKKKPVFIKYDGLPVPFFVESIQNRGTDQALVKFESINKASQADEIAGELIYLEIKPKKTSSKITGPQDLVGYIVINEDGTLIGKITKFYDYPNNPCLGIIMENSPENEVTEQLLPFHEEFILDFNPKELTLIIQYPKGLLDL